MSLPNTPDAPTYRGKTLTPESPRPVHIPEPSNIPVLENQIDPVFNLMSTHMTPPESARNMTAMDQQILEQSAALVIETGPEIMEDDQGNGNEKSSEAGEEQGIQGSVQAEEVSIAPERNEAKQEHSESSINHDQASTLTDQPSASLASLDVLPSSMSNPEPNPIAQSLVAEAQESSDSLEPSQASAPNIDQPIQTAGDESNAPTEGQASGDAGGEGVNYQALLDNILPFSAPNVSDANVSTGNFPTEDQPVDVPAPSSANLPPPNLPASAGLPPRPPPQEKPAIHPNYVPGEDIRSYHFPHLHNTNQPNQSSQASNSYRPQQAFQPASATGSNGLPPPPMASFQQPAGDGSDQLKSPAKENGQKGHPPNRKNKGSRDDETRWGKEVQAIYDQFLDDEAIYTAEGTWDKFPQGSRLFVGNLPTEIVTKRDIFHIFYRYGKLAQISIKQAYGFVQFMDVSAAYEALKNEQNGKIKDRNMHLEISKPPKNSRNAQPTSAGERLRAGHYRRSRSPERRPGSRDTGRGGPDRFNRRDEPRRRDDYRPGRSPSPRGFRGRDSYRGGRSPDRYTGGRDRSRSPYGRSRYDRGQSPGRRGFDEDDNLPMRRRDPRDVPEVQIFLMEDLDRAFIDFVEKSLKSNGLKVAVLQMPPHVSHDAVVKRQILEGVQAIIRLTRPAQVSALVPVQLFDRSGGGNQARWENYDDLAVHVAAALINRNKSKQPPLLSQPSYGAPPQPSYGAPNPLIPGAQPHLPQQPQQQQQQPQAPNLSNLITQLDQATLQKLMGALQNTPNTPQSAMQSALQSPSQNPDLAALLASATQASQQQQQGQQQAPHHGFFQAPSHQQQSAPQQQAQQFAFGGFAHPQQQGGQQPSQYQYQPGGPQPQPQQVQDLMQQLAKFRQ